MRQRILIPYTFIAFCLFLSSCYDRNIILDKQDFENGKWLLIDRNRVTDSIRGITDIRILKEYTKKLIVKFDEDDRGTTCDGLIELYKNGRLINSQEYLSNSRVSQPVGLDQSYRPCKLFFIQTSTKDVRNEVFDSLKRSDDNYPIFNAESADDSSSVSYYKFIYSKNAR